MTVPISFQNVSVSFGSSIVHRDITFTINAGETVTILGPSGTGKTLILKMIMGFLFPRSGSVHVMGQEPVKLSKPELTKMRLDVGMLFQGAALFDSLNVFENVAYSLRERATFSEEQIREIVTQKLEEVGLPGVENKLPSELSGGMRKRVGLARALASSPKIMLYDEPTTGLDPTTTKRIDDLILKLRATYNMTSIVVTHDIASARRVSDRLILVHKGLVLADGKVAQVSADNLQLKKFISGDWEDT